MPLDPSIITNSMSNMAANMPDVNALMQQRVQGMENIYKIQMARQEQDKLAQKEQQAAIAQMMLPSVAAAFSDPSDAGLAAAASLMPPEAAEAFAPFMDRLRGVPDPKLRQALLRAELLKDDEGKLILAQLEPTANMRLQADTAAQAQALKMRELQLQEREAAAKAAPISTEVPPVELQKGEYVNPETGRVEVAKGTKLYTETAAKHKDAYTAASNVQDKVAEAQNKLSYILDPAQKGGFQGNFGGYNAAFATQYFPGQTQDVRTMLDSLKADLKSAGLELMRTGGSIGQITEREWPIIEAQLANVTPYISEDQARLILQNVSDRLNNIAARAAEAYDMEWSDTQFYAPIKAKTPRSLMPEDRGGGDDVVDENNPLLSGGK